MHETLTQDHRWAAKSKATRFKVVENAIQIGGWTKEPHVKRFRMSTYVFAPKIQAGSDRKNSGTVPGSFLASDLWVGKAGSLGFQDGPPWLTLLKGSATNVVGLPMELLDDMLRSF
jgi:hypothetical protein